MITSHSKSFCGGAVLLRPPLVRDQGAASLRPRVAPRSFLTLARRPSASSRPSVPPPASPPKPNIILIYSDDHGFADLGAQGVDRDIRTPHLDALARDGVRFERGYVTAPQCVPSRGSDHRPLPAALRRRRQPEGPAPLAELTIAEGLTAAGYVSATSANGTSSRRRAAT